MRGVEPSAIDADRQGARDVLGNAILNGKKIAGRDVETIRPDLTASAGVDQLHGDPNHVLRAANAATQNVGRHRRNVAATAPDRAS